jgi:hypothetical protein
MENVNEMKESIDLLNEQYNEMKKRYDISCWI